ncbi:MAG: DoxX family protein [Chitinophagales bacterium]
MNTTLWIIRWILVFIFLLSGASKLFQSKEKVIATAGKWAEGYTQEQLKALGLGEMVLALLLVVPKLFGHGYYLSPLAALGISVVMIGAAYTHYKRAEYALLILNIVLMLLALFVAILTLPFMQHWNFA